MSEQQVSLQELESELDRYIHDVENSATVVVSRDGRQVARIIPEADSAEQKRTALKASGTFDWSGRRPKSRRPSVRLRDGGSVSEQPRPAGVLSAPPPGPDSGSPPNAVAAPPARPTWTASPAGWRGPRALRGEAMSKQESAKVFLRQGRLAELTGDADTAVAHPRLPTAHP